MKELCFVHWTRLLSFRLPAGYRCFSLLLLPLYFQFIRMANLLSFRVPEAVSPAFEDRQLLRPFVLIRNTDFF